jgi:hypothetical protein
MYKQVPLPSVHLAKVSPGLLVTDPHHPRNSKNGLHLAVMDQDIQIRSDGLMATPQKQDVRNTDDKLL